VARNYGGRNKRGFQRSRGVRGTGRLASRRLARRESFEADLNSPLETGAPLLNASYATLVRGPCLRERNGKICEVTLRDYALITFVPPSQRGSLPIARDASESETESWKIAPRSLVARSRLDSSSPACEMACE